MATIGTKKTLKKKKNFSNELMICVERSSKCYAFLKA